MIAVLNSIIADGDNKRRTHLGVGEVVEGTLVGSISLREFIHHQITMPKRAPDFSTGIVDCQDPLKVLSSLLKKYEMHENESEEGLYNKKNKGNILRIVVMDETGSNASPPFFFKKELTRAKTEHEFILILIYLFVAK